MKTCSANRVRVAGGTSPGQIEILVGAGGRFNGNAMNDRREPVPNATVVLVPDGASRQRRDLFRSASTDISGRFSIQGIPAATYKAFAFEEVSVDAWQNPDFMRPLESRAHRLKFVTAIRRAPTFRSFRRPNVKRMKRILPILFLTLLAESAALQQQGTSSATASIEGTIVRYGTNDVLSKASVELVRVGGGAGGSATTTTEADGRFYFPNIAPGTYRLYSRRDGYWPAEFGQRWTDGPGQALTLGAGLELRDVPVVMTPGGVITGRIIGRDGRPLAGARVRAMKPWIQENQRQLRPVQEVVANDLGEFRLIWLMPGRYYLSATFVDYSPAPQASQLVIDPDAAVGLANGTRSVSRPVTSRPLGNGLEDDEVYTPIYFPTTLDSDQALAIELKQGEEYRGADIAWHPSGRFTFAVL